MSRHLDADDDLVWIRFPHDDELLAVVRALPERRFHRRERAWTVPIEHFTTVVARLEQHRFKFSPRVRKMWADAPEEPSADGLTVAQVNERVRRLIESEFSESFWVVGELQGFDRNDKKKHAWFELVERPRKNADPTAQVRCVCFRQTRLQLAQKLRSFPDIEFRDGLSVRLLVKPTLYPKRGAFQLVMEDLDPYFTAGELQRRREKIIEAMQKLGIATQNRSIAMPRVPLRVALITSPSGDARRDFVTELAQSGFRFRVEMIPAAMQGERTETTVVHALQEVARRSREFDVVCLVRGGGARSDLSFFDTELVARTACELPLKLVVGVGHQRDRCALDELATSAKTPTAAASLLVERVREFYEGVLACERDLERVVGLRMTAARQVWREAAYRVGAEAPRLLRRSSKRLERTTGGVVEAGRARLARASDRLRRVHDQLEQRSFQCTRDASRELRAASARLSSERLARRSEIERRGLDNMLERLERAAANVLRESERTITSVDRAVRLVHPDRVVERGYALVRLDGELITRAEQLESGVQPVLTFRDGVATVTIEQVELNEGDDE